MCLWERGPLLLLLARMTRYSVRPRAPSPPRSPTTSEEDAASNASDNTYSVVQDDLGSRGGRSPPAPPPKTRLGATSGGGGGGRLGGLQRRRMFGDSVDPSPTGSVLSASPSSSSAASNNAAVEELASLYQARNGVGVSSGGGGKKYDAVTVEEIKAQFQKQIEAMLQSQERHEQKRATTTDANRVKLQVSSSTQHQRPQQQQQPPGLRKGHLPTTSEKELTGIRDLQRGKSFAEARTAVQKHIERMFSEPSSAGDSAGGHASVPKRPEAIIKHTMHGVSHRQGDDDDIEPPPPTHYGVSQAIRDRNNNNRIGEVEVEDEAGGGSGRWRSVESLLGGGGQTGRRTRPEEGGRNRSDLTPSKFRSVDNLRSDSASSASGLGKLRRTVVDIDIEGDCDEKEDDEERLRRYKMENGKPWEGEWGRSAISFFYPHFISVLHGHGEVKAVSCLWAPPKKSVVPATCNCIV